MVGPLVMGAGYKAMRFHGQAKTCAKRPGEANANSNFPLVERAANPICVHETAMEFRRRTGVPND